MSTANDVEQDNYEEVKKDELRVSIIFIHSFNGEKCMISKRGKYMKWE